MYVFRSFSLINFENKIQQHRVKILLEAGLEHKPKLKALTRSGQEKKQSIHSKAETLALIKTSFDKFLKQINWRKSACCLMFFFIFGVFLSQYIGNTTKCTLNCAFGHH